MTVVLQVTKLWTRLSILAGLLMMAASSAGLFVASTYAKETMNWGTQGRGQDMVNLSLAAPILFVSTYFVNKGSLRAFLIWLGTLIYLIYSYLLYAFFIHFGPWFLAYVAILGMSFYAFVGSLLELDWKGLSPRYADVSVKAASSFLMFLAVAFFLLWTSEIMKALLSHTQPQGLKDAGLPVNPVHVLDMALLLPAMAIVSVKLWKREMLGFIFGVPFLALGALLGFAVLSMMLFLAAKGFPTPIGIQVAMTISILVSLYLTFKFLNEIKDRRN